MPRCPHYGCNKTALFKRNLRCGNCDSSRQAPRMIQNFGNHNSGQTKASLSHDYQHTPVLINSLQVETNEDQKNSFDHKHIDTCNTEPSYSHSSYGSSTESYSGGGDFSGGGSGGDY